MCIYRAGTLCFFFFLLIGRSGRKKKKGYLFGIRYTSQMQNMYSRFVAENKKKGA